MTVKKIKIITILAVFTFSLLAASLAWADTIDQVNQGLVNTGGAAGYPIESGKPAQTFAQALSTYMNGMLALIGFLFMVLVIFAGWLWLSAQGKEDQVKRAKDIIINSIVALAIIVCARLIVELALYYLGQTL